MDGNQMFFFYQSTVNEIMTCKLNPVQYFETAGDMEV